MYVITIDQRKSRAQRSSIDRWVTELNERHARHLLLPFEQTVGDELQGVSNDPLPVIDCVLAGVQFGEWWVGVGVGTGELDTTSPRSRGEAFYSAREAIDAAKKSSYGFAVRRGGESVKDAEACLTLVGFVIRKRGKRQTSWEAVELRRQGLKLDQIAERLGISMQAVHSRLTAAGYEEEQAGRELADRLLREADSV